MSLDATLPTDNTTTLAEYAALLRATREEVNTLATAVAALGGAVASVSTLSCGSGKTQIVVGTDVGDITLETVLITGTAAVDIDEIVQGRAGQIKVFIFGDTNITFSNANDKIDLNCVGDYTSAAGDVVALVNIDGDPDISENGYWKEIFRNLAV